MVVLSVGAALLWQIIITHNHTECPLVGTMNKLREQAGFKPITVVDDTLLISNEKAFLDVEKVVKALKMRVDALEKRSWNLKGPT